MVALLNRGLDALFPPANPTVEALEQCKEYITNKQIDELLTQKVDLIAEGVFMVLVLAKGFWTAVLGAGVVGMGFALVHHFSVVIPDPLKETVKKIEEILGFKGVRTTVCLFGILLVHAAPNPTAFATTFVISVAIYRRATQGNAN